MQALPRPLFAFSVIVATLVASQTAVADNLELSLRHRVETAEGSGRFHTLTRQESWRPEQTAIIVCDMWDLHHCLNAVRREGEFAPRLEEVLKTAREAGVTIIHAPSSCMEFYEGTPARERATAAPQADNLPQDIGTWCHKIPAEEQGTYPIDQSDGGEDDDPAEHAEWAAKLKAMGRNPDAPWKRQIDVLTIDQQRDYITDQGDETWNILEARGIENVILTGVHTNMCVLGRPFGLRQLAKNGKNVVLMRDLTDTMYNPQAWPFVSHFTGTDLIIEHIEKFVCPTITSDQLIGGEAFVFKNDDRPHVVMLIGEQEYRTNETLPPFAVEQLGKEYKVSIIHADENDRNKFPGIEIVKEADVLLVSVRRRTLPKEQLDYVRKHVAAGKPVIGIRTASHAFTLRRQDPPEGLSAWPEFDAQVFGGNYSNHHGNKLVATIHVIEKNADHPILEGIPREEFKSNGSLYVVSPLARGTTPLLRGRVDGHEPEPVAWTFERADGGQSFYTSLGHPDDFETPAFVRLLKNGVDWAAEQREQIGEVLGRRVFRDEIRTEGNVSLNDELHRLFTAPLMERYQRKHEAELDATPSEIASATSRFQQQQRDLGDTEGLRDQSFAEWYVDRWKVQRHFYEHFGGGRVIWQQAGLEAFDAMHRWLQSEEQDGRFQIRDPELRSIFYEYWTSGPSFVIEDEKRLQREFLEPEWLRTTGSPE